MQNRFGGIVCLCFAALWAEPGYGQTNPAVGIVLSTRDAQVGSVPATPGVTIFSGDRLTTPKGSGLIVQAGKFQFWLHENTTATLVTRPQGLAFELESGSATFSSSAADAGQTLEIFVSDLRIVPQTAQALQGHVTIQGACEILVTSQKSGLKISRGTEIKEVPESNSVQVNPRNPVEPRPRGVALGDDTFHRGHTHGSCPQPAAAAKGAVMDWVYPVVFMKAATVTAALLARREGSSPFR